MCMSTNSLSVAGRLLSNLYPCQCGLSSNPSTQSVLRTFTDALLFGGLFALLVNPPKSYVVVRFSCDVSVARSRPLPPAAASAHNRELWTTHCPGPPSGLCRRAKGKDIADRRQRLRKASFRPASRVPRLPRGNARSRVRPRHRRRGRCCRLVVRVEIASSVGSPSMASSSCQRANDPVPEPSIGSEGIYSLRRPCTASRSSIAPESMWIAPDLQTGLEAGCVLGNAPKLPINSHDRHTTPALRWTLRWGVRPRAMTEIFVFPRKTSSSPSPMDLQLTGREREREKACLLRCMLTDTAAATCHPLFLLLGKVQSLSVTSCLFKCNHDLLFNTASGFPLDSCGDHHGSRRTSGRYDAPRVVERQCSSSSSSNEVERIRFCPLPQQPPFKQRVRSSSHQ
jgi:hypothetical protein